MTLVDDHVYWKEVHDFLESFPDGPAAHGSPEVARLVASFFLTSGALEMEVCLAKIHYKVNLRGYVENDFLVNLTYNTTNLSRTNPNTRLSPLYAPIQTGPATQSSSHPPNTQSTPAPPARPTAVPPATQKIQGYLVFDDDKKSMFLNVIDRDEWRRLNPRSRITLSVLKKTNDTYGGGRRRY